MCLVNISIAKGITPSDAVVYKYRVIELLDMFESAEVIRLMNTDLDVKAVTKVGIVPISTLQMMAVTELVMLGGNNTYNSVLDVVNRLYALFEIEKP